MPVLRRKSGFTLAELMIVIGTIGILSGIVITAVNPKKQLVVANNAARLTAANDLSKAFQTFLIDHPHNAEMLIQEIRLKGEDAEGGLVKICAGDTVDVSCVNLSVLEVSIPQDPLEPNPIYTGFEIAVDEEGLVSVEPEWIEDESGGDDTAMMPQPPDVTTPQIYYWNELQEGIYRQPLTGGSSSSPTVVIPDIADVQALLIEPVTKKIYWASDGEGLFRANLNGSSIESIAPDIDSVFAVDPIRGHIYYHGEWTGQGADLMRMKLDGSNPESLFVFDMSPIFDFEDGHIYTHGETLANRWISRIDLGPGDQFSHVYPPWEDWVDEYSEYLSYSGTGFDPEKEQYYYIVNDHNDGGGPVVMRRDDDGENPQIVTVPESGPDYGSYQVGPGESLYWTVEREFGDTIERFAAGVEETIYTSPALGAYYLSIDPLNNKLVWSENYGGIHAIMRSDLDAQSVETFVPNASKYALYLP